MSLCGQQIMPDDPDEPPQYCARQALKHVGVCREHAEMYDPDLYHDMRVEREMEDR